MNKIPLFKVHIPIEEAISNIRKVFESGFINEGIQVTEFSQALRSEFDKAWPTNKYYEIIPLNSCTSALTLSLILAGVGPDDDVVSTSMTCVATNTPIVGLGANIVWADVDPLNGLMTPSTVRRSITEKTKAVIAVAFGGILPDITGLKLVCDEYNIPLILDAAHAMLSGFEQLPVYEIPDYTCFSLQAIKHITTGDGGLLVMHDLEKIHQAKCLKWFGFDRDSVKDAAGNWKGQQWDADVQESGFKMNMNNLSAALGLAQIPHLSSLVAKYNTNALRLRSELNNILRPALVPNKVSPSHWVCTFLAKDEIERDKLVVSLNQTGIMAGLVHVPNHEYTAFKSFIKELPGTDEFAKKQFSLPCGWWISEEDLSEMIQTVQKCYREI